MSTPQTNSGETAKNAADTAVLPPTQTAATPVSSAETLKTQSAFTKAVESIGARFIKKTEAFGLFLMLFGQMLVATVRPPYRIKQLLISMEFVGYGSLFIIMLTGFFTGAILAYQCAYAFGLFGAESLTGSTVSLAMTRELGPALTAIMVAGRASSGMATVLGTMRVTEQIDAMKTMAVDPVQYLIVPRVWATVIMLPVLCAVFDFMGIIASYVFGIFLAGIEFGPFDAMIGTIMNPHDVTGGMIKAAVFGLLISFIGCYKGFYAEGGAKGVGEATTDAVVYASVTVLILDYFLTMIIW